MGFFSSLCEGCEHPLLVPHATEPVNRWMSKVIAITEDGNIYRGIYDGYGGIDDSDSPASAGHAEGIVVVDSTVWHQACWDVAGKPAEWRGGSANAPDQGWFFEDGAHDMLEPARQS